MTQHMTHHGKPSTKQAAHSQKLETYEVFEDTASRKAPARIALNHPTIMLLTDQERPIRGSISFQLPWELA